ncbi:MAG TPA: hypothetical protein VI455_04555 [Terriglobia bacterium]
MPAGGGASTAQLKAAATMDRLAHQFEDWAAEQILRESRDRRRFRKG